MIKPKGMTIGATEGTTDNTDGGDSVDSVYSAAHTIDSKAAEGCPRIALLTPYAGGNLGDAAIQDAMISNVRLRLPDAQFAGISLNCDNFIRKHGISAFPLCETDRPFYAMSRGYAADPAVQEQIPVKRRKQKDFGAARVKTALKRIPALWRCLKVAQALVTTPGRELRHCLEGYRFLRTQDLLIVSGGGQLDEEWGGAWGHPYALLKWAVLARFARIPYVMASVGAQKASSTTSRLFMSVALRLSNYRSYRDKHSREIVAGLLQRANEDPVVPDLAFSLPPLELPPTSRIRTITQCRPIIAISPIAYAKPGNWPWQDRALYERYLQQMALAVSQFLNRGCFLNMICSSLGDDDSVIPDLLGRLDDEARKRLAVQMHIPAIATWKDVVVALRNVDILIACRLHSAILGFVTRTPTIAISFDPKVDWVMEDLGHTDYLLQIRDFAARDVIEALDRIELRKNVVLEQIASYQHRISSVCALQYDALAELAMTSCQCRH